MKKYIMVKKLMTLGVVILMFFSLAGCDPLIDPGITFNNLEEVQDVLSNDFYFFNFDTKKILPRGYTVITNTQSYRRRERGDFEYIGYDIGFSMYPITGTYHKNSFSASAILGKTLDGLVDEIRKNVDSNITDDEIVIGDVNCIYISRANVSYQLYFMLDNIRYCFEMNLTTISEKEALFLEICQTAIETRYKAK